MALVTEDGSGLANAESYCSVVDASARHAAIGNTNWATITTAEMEQALRRATNYMRQAYRTRWTGRKSHWLQALDWPRYSVTVDGWPVLTTIVPPEVIAACADLALKAAAGELAVDLARGVVREKIGPLETDYDRYSPQAIRYRAIDMALAPFLMGSSANIRLERA
jgi:hypothetical protein